MSFPDFHNELQRQDTSARKASFSGRLKMPAKICASEPCAKSNRFKRRLDAGLGALGFTITGAKCRCGFRDFQFQDNKSPKNYSVS